MEKSRKKSITFQQIADEYNVETRTLYNWLKPIRKELLDMYGGGRTRLRVLTPKQVSRINQFVVLL